MLAGVTTSEGRPVTAPTPSAAAGAWQSPPSVAAWRHNDAREGFEVTFFRRHGSGWRLQGSTAAVEAGQAWIVEYTIEVDAGWRTLHARVTSRSVAGLFHVELEGDAHGSWRVDGRPAPRLQGCLDVDLEASAMTNSLPVHRLPLAPGEPAAAPAAYVRADGLAVERLEQTYERLPGGERRFAYAAPTFDTAHELRFDGAGLVVDYPGLAVRVR
ncbi:putative glycolipid-binding domain-containing protein [Georgenia yuyongxinii]|uniref:putative glycolipid-binding domain-containing protein n=1 Tax=Georgenia yuyongxinii TaxID=2589797 RepID=UPI002ED9A567